MSVFRIPSLVVLFLVALIVELRAQVSPTAPASATMKKLSLEELLALQVTSVSRRAEPASHAAAAVEVITPEQIARTGAASVQDALRLATGLQVSGYGGHSFAISSRGFASLAANKLQVMEDGRSLYSPLFTGVFWDGYGVMMEDLDRIEVIRGPGATMWGANAVNGVISIVTKDARDTQGSLVTAGGGSYEHLFGAVRYGGQVGSNTFYRVYARGHDRSGMALPDGQNAIASPREMQTGFRVDSRSNEDNHVTVQGDYFENSTETGRSVDATNRDLHLLSRWTRALDADSELQIQSYVDHFERRIPLQMGDRRNTFDFDAQYRSQAWRNHNIMTGLNYRVSSDHTAAGGTTQFLPRARTVSLASAFVQDEIAVVPNRFSVVLGSKFQWDSLGGFEPQPNLRAAWTPDERHTVWAAASRAVRMPTRIDEDLQFLPVPASGIVAFQGNPNFKPEILDAYELGYRVRPVSRLYFDLTAFYHKYDQLRSLEPTLPQGIPFVQYNRLDAETSGVELSVKWEPTAWWRLSGNYSYLRRRLEPEANSRDPNRGTLEGNDAPRLYSLWSSIDLPRQVTIDLILRHVAALPQPFVPSYTEMDVRLGWSPSKSLELALVGQNLLHRQHREFGPASPTTAEIKRGFYGKVTWRF